MRSMTGFATAQGQVEAASKTGGEVAWRWDLRSVNGRGLEIRFRTPPNWDAEEPKWRALIQKACARGSISATLTLSEQSAERAPRLNDAALEQAIDAARLVEERALAAGLTPQPISIDGLLSLRGVFGAEAQGGDDERRAAPSDVLAKAALEGLEAAVSGLAAAREGEGARLKATLLERIDEIDRLRENAAGAAAARAQSAGERLKEKASALLAAVGGGEIDQNRLSQELALLAVKQDVAEEIDRLSAHVAAARELLAASEPIGRKFEFLTQEFNREANTLCSKAQDAALTDIGLALKVVIDQAREQAANVE